MSIFPKLYQFQAHSVYHFLYDTVNAKLTMEQTILFRELAETTS